MDLSPTLLNNKQDYKLYFFFSFKLNATKTTKNKLFYFLLNIYKNK